MPIRKKRTKTPLAERYTSKEYKAYALWWAKEKLSNIIATSLYTEYSWFSLPPKEVKENRGYPRPNLEPLKPYRRNARYPCQATELEYKNNDL
jgi:hypothetical protein